MTERTFVALEAGKIDCLYIAISIYATKATRKLPDNGIWKLARADFLKIATSIAERDQKFDIMRHREREPSEYSLAKIAVICDETGIDNRFFRLNEEVAAWLDRTKPELEIDFVIG